MFQIKGGIEKSIEVIDHSNCSLDGHLNKLYLEGNVIWIILTNTSTNFKC